jgi:hypothetical protein
VEAGHKSTYALKSQPNPQPSPKAALACHETRRREYKALRIFPMRAFILTSHCLVKMWRANMQDESGKNNEYRLLLNELAIIRLPV